MIYIKREKFMELAKKHPDYIGKCISEHTFNGITCKRGDWCAIEGFITGDFSGGCTLIFERIHFEII